MTNFRTNECYWFRRTNHDWTGLNHNAVNSTDSVRNSVWFKSYIRQHINYWRVFTKCIWCISELYECWEIL